MIKSVDCWSETPDLIREYLSLIDAGDGIMRFFAYASLIDRHDPLKPQASRTLPNERARLYGMEVSINLKTEKLFAGLEVSAKEYAEGVNITVAHPDRDAALTAFIKRELGDPPWGTGIPDILEHKIERFAHLRGTAKDRLEKYKLCIVETQVPAFEGPTTLHAIAVVTNADLPTSLVGASSAHLAKLLREDTQSYGYFRKDALDPARQCNMVQKRLEAIDRELSANG